MVGCGVWKESWSWAHMSSNIPRLCCRLLLGRKPCTHSLLHHSLNEHSLNVKDHVRWWEDNGPCAEVLRLGCTSETPGDFWKSWCPGCALEQTKSESFRSRNQASAFLKCSKWFQYFGLEVKEFYESVGWGNGGSYLGFLEKSIKLPCRWTQSQHVC